MKLDFTKMHGCGNDYVYVIATKSRPANPAALAVRVSDRRFGVGGDGLIMLTPPHDGGDIRMEMFNADGSRGEMCGNGIRCVARLAHDRALVRNSPIAVETDCGIKSVALTFSNGRVDGATVDMGEPILEARDIPVFAEGRFIDHPISVDGKAVRVTAVSMGNPHCVVFVDDDSVFNLDDSAFAKLGRQYEQHPLFPRRTNTEFVRPLSRRALKMRVWERGSGETLACGTGACAALVAAVLTGRAERRSTVEPRGGKLEIAWKESGSGANHVYMSGEAVEVFRGEIELAPGELLAVTGGS